MNQYSVDCEITFQGSDLDELATGDFALFRSSYNPTIRQQYICCSDKVGKLKFILTTKGESVQDVLRYVEWYSKMTHKPDEISISWVDITGVFNETEGRWEELPE